MPRDWFVFQVKYLGGQVKARYGQDAALLEPLTGRPLKSGEGHSEWFLKQFGEQVGNLTDGQLWTLYLWALADWQRMHHQSEGVLFPLDGGGQRFARYWVTDFAPKKGR